MPYPLNRGARVLLWLLSAIIASLLTICIILNIPLPEETETPIKISHDIPTEVLCRVAATPAEEIPDSVLSDKPQVRLREYAPGLYEILYWGNPVRPHYTYSVTKLSTGESILLSTNGRKEKQRPLAVTQPRRADGRLPLQPTTKLTELEKATEHYYAVRVSIHDGTTGKGLCSEVYIISTTRN